MVMKQLAALLLLLGCIAAQPTRKLTDDNFEHVTQASTGQTTGIWVVKFCNHSPKCVALHKPWEHLADEMLQQQVFLAEVDTMESHSLSGRFSIHKSPTILMFRDRKMYKFPHAAFSDDSAMDALRLFISNGHETGKGMEVPPPESEFKRTVRQWIHTIMHSSRVFIAIAAVAGMAVSVVVMVAKPKTD